MAEKNKRKARSRGIDLLTPFEVENAKPDEGRFVKRLLDGKGLYLQATLGKHGAINRNWVFRYELDGVRHDMGIGPLDVCGLAKARAEAAKFRLQLLENIDPLEAREAERAAQEAERRKKLAEEAKAVTFKECFEAFYRVHSKNWKNPKHRAQWRSTLETYAYPVIGDLNVADVDIGHVQKVLNPIWDEIPETATRVQKRIENVLDYATASKFRTGDNPARWKGNLKTLIGVAQKDVEHHPALPFLEAPAFMVELRGQDGVAARALEFTILTAARTGDIVGGGRDEKPPMLWSHVNFDERVWTVPSTKMETEHRVPLSADAVALLKSMEKQHPKGAIVFPGEKPGQPLSNMSMGAAIKRLNKKRAARGAPLFVDPKQDDAPVTVHGFRSTFKDWASERTNYPDIVSEMQLAHAISDKVEAAYRRGPLLTKRANMMKQWAAFLAKPAPTVGATVTHLHEHRAGSV